MSAKTCDDFFKEYRLKKDCCPTADEIWDAAIKSVEVAPSASNNSRYVTALEAVREFVQEAAPNEASKFVDWLYQRLNAEEPHCA